MDTIYSPLYNINNGLGMSNTTSSATEMGIWGIISIVLALVGGVAIYFAFVKTKNEPKGKFLSYLKKFLDFKYYWIETILKVSYLVLALFVTLASFGVIGDSFLSFVFILVLGNVTLRLAYEGALIILTICRNTTEINQKLGNKKNTDQ